MKIAALQMVSEPDVRANLDQALALLRQARDQGAELAALPEYFCAMGLRDTDKLAYRESFGAGPIQDFLRRAARELQLWIVGGTLPLVADDDAHVLNSSLVFSPEGECVARYDKIHHVAEGRIHIADAALQVARAQARDQRVLHGLAKGQRIAQVTLGTQAAAVVAHQHGDHGDQGDGHQRHQGREHVGEHAGRAVPAVHAQHQGAAGQIQQLLRREHARAAPGGAQQGQARAVGLGEGHFLGARQVLADLGDQQALQAVGADDEADDVAALRQRQADLHHLRAQALGQQLEVAGRVGGAVQAARVGAGQHGLGVGVVRAQLVFPLHIAIGGLGMGADLQARVAPLDAHQLAAHLQQFGGAGLPFGGLVVGRVQRLQVLQVAVERCAYVGHGIGRVALQLVLDLGGLVAPGQPDHGDEHAQDQGDQQAP